MKLLTLLALLVCYSEVYAQDRVAQWKGTVTTTNWISNKKVLPATDWSTMNVCVYDSSGGPVMVAFQEADTAAADGNGFSNFATIPPGATFNFPARAVRTIWMKAVGSSATVTVTRY